MIGGLPHARARRHRRQAISTSPCSSNAPRSRPPLEGWPGGCRCSSSPDPQVRAAPRFCRTGKAANDYQAKFVRHESSGADSDEPSISALYSSLLLLIPRRRARRPASANTLVTSLISAWCLSSMLTGTTKPNTRSTGSPSAESKSTGSESFINAALLVFDACDTAMRKRRALVEACATQSLPLDQALEYEFAGNVGTRADQ